MVVCKFFQQGNCRYGQNCRFDHIYGSKYSYHASSHSEPQTAAQAVTDEQLVNQVQMDLQSMMRGGQWLLSCYAPFKEKPEFPGLVNMSPEEARLFIYEARANNTLDEAMSTMNSIFQEAKQRYEILLQKNPNITKVFRSLYNGENVPSPFINRPQPGAPSVYGSNDTAASVFRNAIQPTQPSVFSQNAPSGFPSNTFASNDPAKSIFAQATQNAFQNQNQTPAIFAPTPVPQQTIFSQDMTAQSIFAQGTQSFQNTPPQNVFNTQNAQNIASSIFATASQMFANPATPFQQTPPNVFQKTNNQSSFAAAPTSTIQQSIVSDVGIYSKVEDISPEDMEAFNADEFKMGFIPELPPPQSLCI